MSLFIGAAGPVGKRVIGALIARGKNVVAAMRSTPLPDHLQTTVAEQYLNVNVGDVEQLKDIFRRHPEIGSVWCVSLASASQKEAQVEGLHNLFKAMGEAGVKKMVYMDTIASYGVTAPRRDCTARWLLENPTQHPGSQLGLVKQECRQLMLKFTKELDLDTRFAVVPGVLHTEATWGPAIDQYPLTALATAIENIPYECPVDPERILPMIFVDDLVRGLMDLGDAPRAMLSEPAGGYCIPGFSASAIELFSEIRRHIHSFETVPKLDPRWDELAKTWPASLSRHEALRDLGYKPQFGLGLTVQRILRAHRARRNPAAVKAELTSMSEIFHR